MEFVSYHTRKHIDEIVFGIHILKVFSGNKKAPQFLEVLF